MTQAVPFNCPNCGQVYALPYDYLAQYAEQATTCTGCGGQMQLPQLPSGTGTLPPALPPQAPAYGVPYSAYATNRFVPSGPFCRNSKTLVVRKGERLPAGCVKCGKPGAGPEMKSKLSWHEQWVYAFIFVGLLPYVIISMMLSSSGTVRFQLCAAHRTRRQIAVGSGIFMAVLGVASLVAAATTNINYELDGGVVPVGIVLVIVGLIVALLSLRTFNVNRMAGNYMWLRGAGPEYLAIVDAEVARLPAEHVGDVRWD